MPRTRVTLADLKRRLRERVGDTSTFWNDVEATDALNEAISVWQALAGEWTTQISIPAVSDSPSFYPVAKQIVSLTRVGLADTTEPPGLSVAIYSDAFPQHLRAADEDPEYTTSTGSPVSWAASPTGGVAPYTFLWTFPDGETSTSQFPVWAFPSTLPEGMYTVYCTITDSSDDTHDEEYQIRLLNHTVELDSGPNFDYSGSGPLLTGLIAKISYLGSDHTEYFEPPSGLNQYPRYPIRVTFDFSCVGSFDNDPLQGNVTGVRLEENGGAGVQTYPDGKISYIVRSGWEFTSEGVPPGAGGGKYLGQLMWQDVDGGRWGANSPEIYPIFDTMTQNRINNGETFHGSFKVQVEDATVHSPGHVAEYEVSYNYTIAVADPLCWSWGSNDPNEGDRNLTLAVAVNEEVPGQWDLGGNINVSFQGFSQDYYIDSLDLGFKVIPLTWTLPDAPPAQTFNVTVTETGGVPAVNRSTTASVTISWETGDPNESGISDGCCEYEPYSLFYEECPPDGCIFTGGGGCP